MLQFLKKLLKKEPKEIVVAFSELEDFLRKRAIPYEEALAEDIKSKVEEIEGFRKSILEDLKRVEDANLQNPNIPYRAKVIMQGNRDAFVRSISRFFSSMAFSFDTIPGSVQKSRQLQKEMDELAKSTARSYAILSQFFEKEIEPILASIKKIDDHLKAIISNALQNQSASLHRMIKEVEDIKAKIRLRQSLQEELEGQAKHLDTKQLTKEHTKERIAQKKESKDYLEYEQLLKNKSSHERSLQELENTLFHDFSDLERALKKYSKVSLQHERLILAYLDNALNALLSDENLEIIDLLESMKRSINSLDLDEKRKERVLARISTLNSDYFSHIQKKHSDKQQLLSEVKKDIENNSERAELSMLEETLSRMEFEIDQLSAHMRKTNEHIASLDISGMKKELEKKMNEKLKEKIVLNESLNH